LLSYLLHILLISLIWIVGELSLVMNFTAITSELLTPSSYESKKLKINDEVSHTLTK
jgi:hypothetical protein